MIRERASWLHISDIHAGKDVIGQAAQYKYVLQILEKRLSTDNGPDLVFISGDIANAGLSTEYEQLNDQFFVPLRKLLNSTPILMVPGNHDLDHRAVPFIFRDTIMRKSKCFFDPDENGRKARGELAPRFAAYVEGDRCDFPEIDGHHWLRSSRGVGAFVADIRGNKIGVLGLNTAWLSEIDVPNCGRDCDRNQITPGKVLIEPALDELSDCLIKVVLGHHPLSWFSEGEASPIRALFAKHNVIYLHGHLHKTSSSQDEGAGFNFRTFQAGAVFQAREDERWVNRIVWSEIDFANQVVVVQPYHWSRDYQDWVIDGNAFPPRFKVSNMDVWSFALTDSAQLSSGSTSDPLRGWTLFDSDYVAREVPADDATVLKFFDGRIPTLGLAVHSKIPRRDIVQEIVGDVESAPCGQSSVTAILGAAGEGKSTVLLQTVVALSQLGSSWNILYLTGEVGDDPKPLVDVLLVRGGNWLLACDDAELVAEYVLEATKYLRRKGDGTVHFLVAARDTDWNGQPSLQDRRSNYSRVFEAELNSRYRVKLLRGISKQDARVIVEAWSAFGDEGLGQLKQVPVAQAASQLEETAKQEAARERTDGSFFGALLRLRTGSDLKGHVLHLLQRLELRPVRSTQKASGNRTLLDAVALIACMHSENCFSLTREVLAAALGCEPTEVRANVIIPLGEEAAVDSGGEHSIVLIRHRAVAEAIVDVLQGHWGTDIDDYFEDLVIAVESLYQRGEYIPHFNQWRRMASLFVGQGKINRAIRIARAQVRESARDLHCLLSLANVYVAIDQPAHAKSALVASSEYVMVNRIGVLAVGNVFNKSHSFAESIVLLFFALSDSVDRTPPGLGQCKQTLVNIATTSHNAWRFEPRPEYLEIGVTASTLFTALETDVALHFRTYDVTDLGHRQGIAYDQPKPALSRLRNCTTALSERLSEQLPRWVTDGGNWTYTALARYLKLDERHGI